MGIKFNSIRHDDGNITIKLNQEAFIDSLVAQTELDGEGVTCPVSPYRSGYPIDKIPKENNISDNIQQRQNHLHRILVGSLNWLSTSTRPDIAPITHMLAQYCNSATKGG